MKGQIKVCESPIDMNEAEHAEYGCIVREFADLKVDFDPLQAAIQVRAEEQLLPEVKLIIIARSLHWSNLGASRAILDMLERYAELERLKSRILTQAGHEGLELRMVAHMRTKGQLQVLDGEGALLPQPELAQHRVDRV